MKIRLTLLGLLLLTAVQFVAAQTIDVKGVVYDSKKQPVIGATISKKGGAALASTDVDGKFSITGVKPSDVLVVTYIGMTTQEVKPKTNLRITLEDENTELDEVMVVAFGKQKRSAFTGSAGIVDSKELEKKQVTNALSAINGEVAGVQMVDNSGDPASTPTIRIRGFSSINAGNDPLIILDGAPYDGGINNINPNDIANVTVLKDAASNALYGARGANGVIMITTKSASKGNVGKTTITLDAKWGASSNAAVDYDYIKNPGEYYEMFYRAAKQYYLNKGQSGYDAHTNANSLIYAPTGNGGLGYVVYAVPDGQNLIGDNGKLNPNATLGNRVYNNGEYYTLLPDDWKDEAFRTALRQEYNISVSSSLKSAQIYASLGYLDNEGIVYNSDYERYTARVKADWQAKDWLNIGANASFAHSTRDYVNDNSNGLFYTLMNMSPIYPVYIRDAAGNIMTDNNGKMYDYGDGSVNGIIRGTMTKTNPLQQSALDTNRYIYNNLTLTGYADIMPVEGLKITLNGTVTNNQMRYTGTENPYYGYSATTYTNGYVIKSQSQTYSVNFQQLINYSKSFGKHNMALLLGHENYKLRYDYLYASKQNMASYFGNQNLSGAITIIDAGDNDTSTTAPSTDYNNEGWFFRAQYDYAEKYFASASFRRDGSSRFHPDHRWGNFYSFGGAWIISKESWFTAPWVDQLKLKASVGQQGNDNIGDYRYTDTYNVANSNGNVALVYNNKGNKNITWETNTNFNTGVDFSLFTGRLTGGIEYFYRHTTDMLSFVSAPYEAGYAGQYVNVGAMNNEGFEIDLNGIIIKNKHLTWSVNLNATHYKNKVKSLSGEVKSASYDGHNGYVSGNYFVGEGLSMYSWLLKDYAGVSDDGQSMWYVRNSDGTISTTTSYGDASYFICGTALPDVYGGFGTQLSTYGFDLSLSFNYSIGGKAYDNMYANLMRSPTGDLIGYNFHKDLYNAWSETNTNTDVPRFVYNDAYSASYSSRFLTNASYLTLRNVNLGYTLPKSWISPLGLNSVRVYCTADNIFYISKRKGFDPRGAFNGATDYSTYSPVKSISGGLNIQF